MSKYFECSEHPKAGEIVHDLLMSPTILRITCAWKSGRPGSKEFKWCDKELGKVYQRQDGSWYLEKNNAKR